MAVRTRVSLMRNVFQRSERVIPEPSEGVDWQRWHL
jgi:hypothetical protein